MNYKCPKPIAILLAVYNGEKYLRVQIDSIIEQTNKDWVLYIRDDASTDSTREIIAEYCKNNDNIITIEDDLGNLGCYENFKQLLRVVEAKYYMFSDADDYWLPNKTQASYDFIREKEQLYPNIPIMVHTDKKDGDKDLNIKTESSWKALKIDPDAISNFKYIPIHIAGGACAIFNHLVKPHLYETAPFHISHDGWLALQTARYGKIFALKIPLLIYRRHENNTTHKDKSHPTIKNYIKRIIDFPNTIRYHWKFSSQMQTLGYGGKAKYFYYRIVLMLKILWEKFTI